MRGREAIRILFTAAILFWLLSFAISGWAEIVVNGGTHEEIQAALDKAATWPSKLAAKPGPKAGSVHTKVRETVVLRGEFKIGKTIRWREGDQIRGDGAILNCSKMTDDTAFCFAGSAWQVSITGDLAITGAPNGLKLWTGDLHKNKALGLCYFQGIKIAGCRGVAADTQTRSSTIIFDRCVFDQVAKVAVNRMCDELVFRNCRVYPLAPPEDDYSYVDHSYGTLRLEGGMWTPKNPDNKSGVSWVEMKDCPLTMEFGFQATDTRFGGENKGFVVVRNSVPGRISKNRLPVMEGVHIRLINIRGYKYPNRRSWQHEKNPSDPLVLVDELPNLIEVQGLVGRVAAGRGGAGPIVDVSHRAKDSFSSELERGNVLRPAQIIIGDTNVVQDGTSPVGEPLQAWYKPAQNSNDNPDKEK